MPGRAMPSSMPTGAAIIEASRAIAKARSAGVHFRQSAIQSRIDQALPTPLTTHDI